MNDSLFKYIKDEKDISRYKISLLEKGSKKNYKYRLISIEKDFIEYPFEKINFTDLDELKDALGLFKTDRALFEKRFSKNIVQKTKLVSEKQIEILNKKSEFYQNIYKYLLNFKIKEINLLQDDYIKSKLKTEKDITSMGLDTLAQIEGVSLAKKRARIQILIYCLSRFIFHKTKDIKNSLSADSLSFAAYDKARRSLDNFFVDIRSNIFKHYNDGIEEVPLLINGTLGHNNFINTIYPLINLIDKYPGEYSIKRVLDINKKFFNKNNLPINKKFVSRGLAMITPMTRVGNESIDLLHLDLWSKKGVLINDLMEKEFFNHNINNNYFKAISTKPVWTFNKFIDNKFLLREALTLLGLEDVSLANNINFKDSSVLDRINKGHDGGIFICSKNSKIFIAATRSESEHIKESYNWIDLLIKQIKDDYKSLFGLTVLDDKEREERRIRVRDFGK